MSLRKWIPSGANLEIFRFAVYISAPILLMLYVGNNTHDKLNIDDFWPDPNRLNRIPKNSAELREELARMDAVREQRRQRRLELKKASNSETEQ